jgi:LysM repeat protein
MRLTAAIILILVVIVGAGCSTPAPTWRSKAMDLVNDLGREGGRSFFPREYQNLTETFEHGEAILHVRKDDKEADALYLLVLQKGVVLREDIRRLKELQKEEQRRQAAELAARLLEEKLMREAAEAEERLRKEEQIKAEEEALQKTVAAKEAEVVRPVVYTVRRGETLPQIAARNEIYNDSSLWPIIYRANRDQIRDPKHLWPGQSLKIPRNFSTVEASEAKRFSLKSPQ